MMALTATCTRDDRLSISQTLGLRNPFVLTICPSNAHLVYRVGTFQSIPHTFEKFAERFKKEKGNFPKTIVYGQSFVRCGEMYLFLKQCLGVSFLNPVDAPDLPQFRLVEMFTSVTQSEHKSQIIDLFKRNSSLRVVISTMAFGMGIDCNNVRQIIHIGISDNVASYIQETGRCGRDGDTAVVTLLKAPYYHPVDDDIKRYVSDNLQCRRVSLFSEMDNYTPIDCSSNCLCCDICYKSCTCQNCEKNLKNFVLFD